MWTGNAPLPARQAGGATAVLEPRQLLRGPLMAREEDDMPGTNWIEIAALFLGLCAGEGPWGPVAAIGDEPEPLDVAAGLP